MNQEKLKNIYDKSRLICSIMAAIAAVSYIIGVYHLYLTGGDMPYSRERVGVYLLYLLPISILTVLAFISSGVLALAITSADKRLKAIITPSVSMRKLYRRYRISAFGKTGKGKGDKCLIATPEVYDSITSHHRTRVVANIIYATVNFVVLTLSLIPILDTSAYTLEDLDGAVMRACLFALPLVFTLIGGAIIIRWVCEKSYVRETEQLKELIATTTPTDVPLTPSYENKKRLAIGITRIAVLTLAVALVIIGIAKGNLVGVIEKAVAICSECIGLG
ncbi:MAG: hypothetical protein IJY69_03520 [Clostridia bacterium]|nr:hypothetical protein [Clostridia bacterium]